MRFAVNEEVLGVLRDALKEYGEKYKNNLLSLERLMEEITHGHIQGQIAQDIYNKYESKRADFMALEEQIDIAEGIVEYEGMDFQNALSSIKSSIH